MNPSATDNTLDQAAQALRDRRFGDGEAILRRHLAAAPWDHVALNLMGALALETEQMVAAQHYFGQACLNAPNWPDPLINAAELFRRFDQAAEARMLAAKAIALAPASEPAINNFACALRDLGRIDDSLPWFLRQSALGPPTPRLLANLAATFNDIGLGAAADLAIRQALAILPADPSMWSIRADIRAMRDGAKAALPLYARIAALDPRAHAISAVEGMLRLKLGDYERGWPLYERRLDTPRNRAKIALTRAPVWRGEPLAGRSIMLWHEQGIGDNIQLIRFLPDLARAGAQVFMSLQRPLHPLAHDLPATLVDDARPPPTDFQTALVSLGRHFAAAPDWRLWRGPYLQAPAPARRRWRDRLAALGETRLKIGLVWSGSRAFKRDFLRSPGLAPFASLLRRTDCRIFGLQVGDGRDQMAQIDLPDDFVDLGGEIADMGDTAAIMSELDLIISSCTGPAHLAGALGRPLWLVLPADADWRWMEDRTDSPWYPTARLYRQPRPGDWQTPIAALMADLDAFSRT